MKVTAKLAYSQLKINRLRTFWTLTAIALSTALTTAVCSFVASGNAMIIGFLGNDYGEYRGQYISLLLIPAILFGIIIVSMSVIVVSNVFRISAGERVTQFGILKCVGATKNQITKIVMYESIFLSIVGIPMGIFLGLGLTFVGIKVADGFLDEVNELTQIMINEFHLSIDFVLSWQALLISALISFLSVIVSAWIPAQRAAKSSAVDSVSGAGEIKVEKHKLHPSHLIQRLFGFEGALAAKNIRRNRHNFRATVIALSSGIILFICLGALSTQANKLEEYMSPKSDETVVSDYASAQIKQKNKETGRWESIYLQPIDSEIGNLVAERLKEFDGKDVFGMGCDFETYYTVLSMADISKEMREVLKELDNSDNSDELERQSQELAVDLLVLDRINYQKICKKAGVSVGSAILVNNYRYNDNGNEVSIVPYSDELKSIELMKADGSSSEVAVSGFLKAEDIPKELIYPNRNPICLIVEQAQVRGYSWYSAPENEGEFIAYANEVLAQVFPESEDSNYMEEGFSTRVYKIDDYMKVMNIAIVLVSVFMYSFVVLLMLIGFTNVVSTMSANVWMRSREFAVLQSVGMTPEGLKRMLTLESVLCSLKAIFVGVPLAILLTYFINLPIRSLYPIPYQVPWLAVLLCSSCVFLITWCTTRFAARKIQRQNIIETIRF